MRLFKWVRRDRAGASKSLRIFAASVYFLAIVAGLLASLSLIILMFGGALDAILRSLGSSGLRGLIEYGEVLLVILAFLGLGRAEQRASHVRLDLVLSRVPPRAAAVAEGSGLAIVLALLLLMVYATGQAAIDSIVSGEVRVGIQSVNVWPGRLSVTIGTAVVALVLSVRIAVLVRFVWKGDHGAYGLDGVLFRGESRGPEDAL